MPLRAKATLIHFFGSLAIISGALAWVYVVWYPGAIAQLQGTSRIVGLTLISAIAAGPVLTLLTFSRKKTRKQLYFDACAIAALQISAVSLGLFTLFQNRPVYLVFNTDRITIVAAQEVAKDSLARAPHPMPRTLSWLGPRLVASRLPDDQSTRASLIFLTLGSGIDLPQMPEWHVPYSAEQATLLKNLQELGEIRPTQASQDDRQWQATLARHTDTPAHLIGYLPVVGARHDGSALIHRQTGELLAITTIPPDWQP